uniref:Similar to A3IQ63_9CHRO Hypothetical protein n=1 Tax=Microcystis aeruginosa (strain PCC 7806) TaxID=267872 RepID=A8YGV4_MICA7|nr:unnamed protein product [Microcystis aeruginosa PCC 7806]
MVHVESARTKRFRQLFLSLPQRVQETAKKNYEIWKENPFHPSLEFKEVKPREKICPVRVGIGWRALGINLGIKKSDEEKIVWFWVGSHSEYDKILGKN